MGITILLKVSLDKKLCEVSCFLNEKIEQKDTNKTLRVTCKSVSI